MRQVWVAPIRVMEGPGRFRSIFSRLPFQSVLLLAERVFLSLSLPARVSVTLSACRVCNRITILSLDNNHVCCTLFIAYVLNV